MYTVYLYLVPWALAHIAASASQLYDCSGGVHNAQLVNKVPYTGCFSKGQGTEAGKTNKADPQVGLWWYQCWDELYVVHAAPVWGPYEPISGYITDGSVSQQNQTQSCTTTSNGITFGGFQLVEKFFIGLLVQLSESVSYTITHTNAVCDTSSITVTCPYKQGCQQLCAQQQRLNYYGYKIRRCRHGLLFGHVSDICIQDFVASVPINTDEAWNKNCDGICSEQDPCPPNSFAANQPPLDKPDSCFKFGNTIQPNPS